MFRNKGFSRPASCVQLISFKETLQPPSAQQFGIFKGKQLIKKLSDKPQSHSTVSTNDLNFIILQSSSLQTLPTQINDNNSRFFNKEPFLQYCSQQSLIPLQLLDEPVTGNSKDVLQHLRQIGRPNRSYTNFRSIPLKEELNNFGSIPLKEKVKIPEHKFKRVIKKTISVQKEIVYGNDEKVCQLGLKDTKNILVDISGINDGLNQKCVDGEQNIKILNHQPEDMEQMNFEIKKAQKLVEDQVKASQQFLDELFIEDNFAPWLSTSKSTLTDAQLKHIFQFFKQKQQLIDQNEDIDSILDFDLLESIVKGLAFFDRFTKSTSINILRLANHCTVAPGQYVYQRGDPADYLYIILSGSVVIKSKFDNNDNVIGSLYDGQHFGELADNKNNNDELLLEEKLKNINLSQFQTVRNHLNGLDQQNNKQAKTDETVHMQSIQTTETTELLYIVRDSFRNILMLLNKNQLELKITMLRSMRIFMEIQPFSLIPFAHQLIQNIYGFDEVVNREGEQLEYMHIIQKGSCNVIRTCKAIRPNSPIFHSRGAIKALPNLRFGDNQLQSRQLTGSPINEPKPQFQGIKDRVHDYQVLQNKNRNKIVYSKTAIYRRLFPGDIIFARAITGMTLEGENRMDKSRMTIVSTSSNTVIYSISRSLLQFCPDYLVEHIINKLNAIIDVDTIQPQPINQQIKELHKLLKSEPNIQDFEKKINAIDAIKIKKQKKQIRDIQKQQQLKKSQNEGKQDLRNDYWEKFKNNLVLDEVTEMGKERLTNKYKKY